ncbi:MAG: arylsulfatase [Verrucomicrobia bacterium]|nr:arylsulfatase [Verrucomicrobiota bacterium]
MSTPPDRSAKPNIVFVLTDDQGYGDLGCHGNPVLKTPNLDALHAESIRFTNFHVGPTCAPTRSGLLTGHYANSTGVWHTVGGRSLLRGNEISLADVFAQTGYRTGLFGKWHLGDNAPYRPQDRGFQHVVCHGGGGISQVPDHWGNDYFDDHYAVNGVMTPFAGYCTDVFFREALRFIEASDESPFLCCITTNAPHSPFNVDAAYSAPYRDQVGTEDRANFYGMIANIDDNFGKLNATLHELGIAENTIVIFMTDNGTSMGDAEYHTCGFRGYKGSEYDGGHRVPFFLRLPGNKAPRDIATLTSHIDFMPTLMDLCGLDLAAFAHCNFHGRSLKPLLETPAGDWPARAIVTDSQRLPNPVKWRKSAVMTDRWRLINGAELYDMDSDKGQQRDIAEAHPAVVAELRDAYEVWWAIVSQQFDDEIPISIGHPNEPVVRLTAHDWRHPDDPKPTDPNTAENNDYLVYDQAHVRQGQGANGYFEVMVEKAGAYRFELCRWPHEEDRAITDGIPASNAGWRADVIQKKNHATYSGGIALPFTAAGIAIGEALQEKSISPTDKAVIFDAVLKPGPTHLATWLRTRDGLERGAYYVYVTGPAA